MGKLEFLIILHGLTLQLWYGVIACCIMISVHIIKRCSIVISFVAKLFCVDCYEVLMDLSSLA